VHHFGTAIQLILKADSLEFWSLTKAQIAQAIAKVGGGLSSDWGVF